MLHFVKEKVRTCLYMHRNFWKDVASEGKSGCPERKEPWPSSPHPHVPFEFYFM